MSRNLIINKYSILGISFSLLFLVTSFYLGKFLLVEAETVNSTNYKIEGLTVGDIGGESQSSTNYKINLSSGGNLNDDKLSSTSYKVGYGAKNVFQANVPKISCFETTTSGSTSCTLAAVNPGGMTRVCGYAGCFNKARFEIDAQNNPTDTLYSVQITTDVTWTTINYVDAATRYIETSATHNISDYVTKTTWESGVGTFNIVGLNPNLTYYLRLTALHGNFTESGTSPVMSVTTAIPTVTFSTQIADATETPTGSSINMGTMEMTSVSTSSDLIWVYFGTNATSGASVYVKDLYNGLRSPSAAYTLPSTEINLATNSGFGIVNRSVTQTYLGPVAVVANYNHGLDYVGALSNSIQSAQIYNSSSQPLLGGKASIYVKGKPVEASPFKADYTDSLYFTVAANL